VPAAGNPPPGYPPRARRRGWEGRVLLEVTVGPDGRPAAVRVIDSSGFRVLDRAARRAVRRWRFRPATANGRPTESALRVPIRFDLQS
jgi:protein TonB